MDKLLKKIDRLKNSKVKGLVDQRMGEFNYMRQQPGEELFKELSFCLLTANFNAERSMEIQLALDDDFLHIPEDLLIDKLRFFGHRFPEARAKYIMEARHHVDYLKDIVDFFADEQDLREWVVKHVKGLGYKEASHFLRNIGFKNLAIIDFHILDVLAKNSLIEKPKTMTRNKYLEIEGVLKKIGDASGLTQAELDLYLWYMETGKILK